MLFIHFKKEREVAIRRKKSTNQEINLELSCEMSTCKFTKKILSRIPLHIFYLYFLRMHHHYCLQRGFESVWAHFLSGNINEKLVTCNLLSSCWIWHLKFSLVQFLMITRTSFYFAVLSYLWWPRGAIVKFENKN